MKADQPRHPYEATADYQQWYRAVTWAGPGALDPVVDTRFQLLGQDRISTIGSCFAQHLSRHLMRSGLHYYVAEEAPSGMSAEDAVSRQYGTFSARYGNVYTVAQAEQLLQRAYGAFTPVDSAWRRTDGAWADPFRPTVEPAGFADPSAVEADRLAHFQAVRAVIEHSDVLVFTLGLTEAWRSRRDGAVFPTAPGVNAGTYAPADHEFVNYDIDEVRAGLIRFCNTVRSHNSTMRILLTVSPVPLVATFEHRHVLVSTTYSKAVLRVAAQAAVDQLSFVDYFPSYELICAASATRNYYRDDLREVTEQGVAHVMRCFTRHYVDGGQWISTTGTGQDAMSESGSQVICDEETIAAAIKASQ